ncbi:hypothetical protein BT96DRAFT_822014 [Gymnopus androsaceus JB14]|uniref:Uncharacterized protein n=1 Tax=Gymnopus androsaceus JB14 TaxID=1447944 RepID=A0A6A4HLX2_9AGAR|nr:hypothetical protein BT96DRAFT_822014 [Gymnopus androsaceus JB14]
MKTGNGTHTLLTKARTCNRERGLPLEQNTSGPLQLRYSPAGHCAVLVLRCASSFRPFHFVNDHWYKVEVEMRQPGTTIPSVLTLTRDTKLLYKNGAVQLQWYLLVNYDFTLFPNVI